MSLTWEETFCSWAKPPGQSELDRIKNAETAIRKALNTDKLLASKTKIYAQGSYRNNVNVRQESDVDIGILYTGNSFFPDYPKGKTKEDFGNIDGDLLYSNFKSAINKALVNYFGKPSVTRGNKAFNVHANTYRLDADVVPVYEHRRYKDDGSYICGVEFTSDDGNKVINWPERLYDDKHWLNQHYENGVSKNSETSRGYKGVVRILKKLCHKMQDEGYQEAKSIPGFLIECLVFNVPSSLLNQDTWDRNVQSALSYLCFNTKSISNCNDWGEVSELKYIFRGSPASKLQEVHTFINAARTYVGIREL